MWYNYRCVTQGLLRRLEYSAIPDRPLLAELYRALLRWSITYRNMIWGWWRGHRCCNQVLWHIHHDSFLRRLCENVKLVYVIRCSKAVWMRFRSVRLRDLISYLWHSHDFLTAYNLLRHQVILLDWLALSLTSTTFLCTILAVEQVVRADWYLLTILLLLLLHNDILVLGLLRGFSFYCLVGRNLINIVVNEVLFNVLTRAWDILTPHITNFETCWVNRNIRLFFLSLSMLYGAW